MSGLADAMESIMKKAEAANSAAAGDYMQDGLLHCGKCHTPKQCYVEVFGNIRKIGRAHV